MSDIGEYFAAFNDTPKEDFEERENEFKKKYTHGYHWIKFENKIVFGYCCYKNYKWYILNDQNTDSALTLL